MKTEEIYRLLHAINMIEKNKSGNIIITHENKQKSVLLTAETFVIR